MGHVFLPCAFQFSRHDVWYMCPHLRRRDPRPLMGSRHIEQSPRVVWMLQRLLLDNAKHLHCAPVFVVALQRSLITAGIYNDFYGANIPHNREAWLGVSNKVLPPPHTPYCALPPPAPMCSRLCGTTCRTESGYCLYE